MDWLKFAVGRGTILSPTETVLFLVLGAGLLFLFVSGGLSLAAVAMRARAATRARSRSGRESLWKEQLHRVLYDDEAADILWGRVHQKSELDFLHFLVQYARRLQGEERRRICDLAEPYLPHILPFLGRRSESRRARAVQMLGELGLPKMAPTVIEALTDPSPMVAMVAASTLARAETPEYAAEILRRMERFTHWRQDFLVEMVASMGDEAAPALRDILTDTSADSKVRAVAADALAKLSDPDAADPAAAVLASTDDLEVKAATLRVLASVGRDTHLDVVRRASESTEMPVRLAAIRALGRFGAESDLAPLEDTARDDPSPWIAIAAARALKEGGGAPALEALAGSNHPRAALGLQVISEAKSW